MKISSAIIFGWAITYFTCIVLPDIGVSRYFMLLLGISMVVPLVVEKYHPKVASCLFLLTGILEIVGGVFSWTGLQVWAVPDFGNQALYQVSMAFLDFGAGITLLSRVKPELF